MTDDEDDLYAMALGENYHPDSKIPKAECQPNIDNSDTQIPNQQKDNKSEIPPEHVLQFRQLLIRSRNQIKEMKKENEKLKRNLQNVIASGGVVICPNCTHHFRDRLCPMKPAAMRKIRARNLVEIEFETLEDLEQWLYLNQLETNNDGMPTVMDVKKATDPEDHSLKTAGSLLPGLYPLTRKHKLANSSEQTPETRTRPSENEDPIVSSIPSIELTTKKVEQKPKREPITWSNSPKKKETGNRTYSSRSNTSSYELKVKSTERKKEVIVKEDTKNPLNVPSSSEEKPRYKFIRTSEKHSTGTSIDIQPATIEHNTQKIDLKPINKNESEAKLFIEWNAFPVKQSISVIDHIFKRSLERQSFRYSWPKMIVLNGDIPQLEASEIRRPDCHSKEKNTNSVNRGQHMIADSLKSTGVSEEGIAALTEKMVSSIKKTPKDETPEENVLFKIESECSTVKQMEIDVSPLFSENKTSTEDECSLVPTMHQEDMGPETPNYLHNKDNVDTFEESENDVFDEFFPNLRTQTAPDVKLTGWQSSQRSISTDSFGYMVDKDEDELAPLIREDSSVPPNGDGLLNYESENIESTSSNMCSSDWKQFCLEDLEDDTDETTRERKLSEMEKNDEEYENMDWEEDLELSKENFVENPDCDESQMRTPIYLDGLEDQVEIEEPDHADEPEIRNHVESVPLEMNSDFRLSDDDDIVSPVTSTPRPLEKQEDLNEFTNQDDCQRRMDSPIEELDWNFDEDEEDDTADQTVIKNIGVGGTDETNTNAISNVLEDGEISEDEENEITEKKEVRKPVRERIKFIADDKQHDESYNRDRRRDHDSRNSYRRPNGVENRRKTYNWDNQENSTRSLKRRN
uniref:PEHE domain-containing protein n=1 Tax=Caenorhabditis tropicalis TaxID=1561998 RepID=A0A1I7TKC9_9PELO